MNSVPLFLLWIIVKENKNIKLIEQDMLVWLRINHRKDDFNYSSFVWLILKCVTFRNILYYRIGKISVPFRYFFRPLNSLYIDTKKIGGGLYIQHGFATIIAAKLIGENCWINQQVTIGFSNLHDAPVIGNNVTINAGAKVIGGITIGNNSKIGAGTVVVKNVPANCTVVGSEAYIVRRDGIKVDREPLV